MAYKAWIENEYREWKKALWDSSVYDFKDHPMVKRMLGEFDPGIYAGLVESFPLIEQIDNIGRGVSGPISGAGLRMLYYARQVLKKDYSSIVEIGGGVGEFYAILRAIGYRGDYMILDLPEVQEFQRRYLVEVEKVTGLRLPLYTRIYYEACISFHALGEFDDGTKRHYIENVVKYCDHGFMIWNPHSGASQEIPFECKVTPEYPMNHPDCRQLEW